MTAEPGRRQQAMLALAAAAAALTFSTPALADSHLGTSFTTTTTTTAQYHSTATPNKTHIDPVKVSWAKVQEVGECTGSIVNDMLDARFLNTSAAIEKTLLNVSKTWRKNKFWGAMNFLMYNIDNPHSQVAQLRAFGAQSSAYASSIGIQDGALASQYDDFGATLMYTLGQTLSDAWTDALEHSWGTVWTWMKEEMLDGYNNPFNKTHVEDFNKTTPLVSHITNPKCTAPDELPNENWTADDTWYKGCVSMDKRGPTALKFQEKNFKSQQLTCLEGCDPPAGGCTTRTAWRSCDCLKCMVWCLNHGNYGTECGTDRPEQKGMCQTALNTTVGSWCDVQCSSAEGRGRGTVATIILAFLATAAAGGVWRQ